MINKSKIQKDLSNLVFWLDSTMEDDPSGRVNKTTGRKRDNGAQHTVYCNSINSFLFTTNWLLFKLPVAK